MKIRTQNINFKSRKPIIRKADNICRRVNSQYTVISPVKLINIGRSRRDLKSMNLGFMMQSKLEHHIRQDKVLYENKCTSSKFFKRFGELIKRNGLANCGEITRLASLACAVNGLKAIPIIPIAFDSEERYRGQVDHVALAIPLKGDDISFGKFSKQKDVVIIDPWLGIADFAPNAELKYKEHADLLFIKDDEFLTMDPYQNREAIIPEKDFAKLRKAFPELIVDKNK